MEARALKKQQKAKLERELKRPDKGHDLRVLALDAGGVLFDKDEHRSDEDTSQVDRWMRGCVDAVRRIGARGTHRIVVNSFAGRRRGEETRKSIADQLGDVIPADQVFVVRDRDLKWKVCYDAYADVMVDDRFGVLQTIHQQYLARKLAPPRLILFGSRHNAEWLECAADWAALERLI